MGLTANFCSSGWLADHIMAVLLDLHIQQRSLIGFMTMIWGTTLVQILLKVEYATWW